MSNFQTVTKRLHHILEANVCDFVFEILADVAQIFPFKNRKCLVARR